MGIIKAVRKKLLILALVSAWFYIIPLLYQFIFVNTDNPQKVIQQVQNTLRKQEQQFETLVANKATMATLYNSTYTYQQVQELQQLPFAFQVYNAFADSTFELRFWNNNTILPTTADLLHNDGSIIVKRENGYHQFVKQTLLINDVKIVITALLPIYAEYFIETDYLKPSFSANSAFGKKYKISTVPTIYPITNSNGSIVLYLNKINDSRNVGYSWVYVVCRIACLLLLLTLLYQIGASLLNRRSFAIAFGVLVVLLLILRWACFSNYFLFDYTVLEYFDPRIYAANSLFKSLGDLTLNLLFAFVAVLFWIQYYKGVFIFSTNKIAAVRINDIIKLLLFVYITFYTVWIFRSVVMFSKISFNVTNFFSLSFYSIVGFLHIAFLLLLYFIFTQRVLQLQYCCKDKPWLGFIAIACIGLIMLFGNFYWAADTASLLFLIWMLCYYFVVQRLRLLQRNVLFAMHIFWLLFFSLFASLLFNYENNKKERADRIALAKKLAFQSDPNTESLLSIAVAKFDNNFLLKNLNGFYNKERTVALKDTLLSENFVGYLNKFETAIYTYDSLEQPLSNKDSTSYSHFNTLVQNQATAIRGINDLYFLEIGFDLFSYILKKAITDTSGRVMGYFVVQANPITYKNKSAALSPELFKQRNNKLDDNGNNYVYAIYNNLELRKRFFDYDLPTKITLEEMPSQEDTIKYRNGFQELWWKLNKNSVIVVGKKSNNLIALVTLFAYLFFSLLTMLFILALFDWLVLQKASRTTLKQLLQVNFSKQVQGIVWIVSLVTFVVVAVVIISLFESRFTKSNKERLGRTMSILIADVQNKLINNAVFDDVVKIYEPGANEALKETIFQMSEIHNVDFNIYDLEGTLKLSSQPLMESKGILSNKMNTLAYYNLKQKAAAQVVQQEKIGSFNYLSMYVPIRDEKGKAYGYLNVPYYSSESDLKQEISNFLITIINLTAFIFLIAGLIAWLVTNRITNSFQLISNKMKEVSLGKNEIIQWNKNDELGGLIAAYNRMVIQLEASANQLAKTEREGAWREMARQVAHEIKNPLTPMKLSIQYLQKSIANGSTNVQELANNVSKTLVEQIDHLSNIASDFSQFANIGNAKLGQIDVVEMLNSLRDLFNTEPNVAIGIYDNVTSVSIEADKTQINRLFTNLIKNAIQAYDEDAHKTVNIHLHNNDNTIVVSITDAANGIPAELQAKIFTPNFTTKTSGTGLGLAISKGIVENAKGTISFTTQEGEGTTFVVSLPLA